MFCTCGLKMQRKWVLTRAGGPFFPWDLVCPRYRWWKFWNWKHDWRPLDYGDPWD